MDILLVDDEHDSRASVADFLTFLGHTVVQCDNGEDGLAKFKTKAFPLVITDVRMPGMDGIGLLKAIKSDQDIPADVIIYTGHGDTNTAISALRAGAYDYLPKPINVDELALAVERSEEHQRLLHENKELTHNFSDAVERETAGLRERLDKTHDVLRQVSGIGEVVYRSDAMKRIVDSIEALHRDPTVPVLIEGETGTGKEVIARMIHFGDGTTAGPLVDINCAAISSELFEAELFGYTPGSFTGGNPKGAKGKLAVAEGGSVFLDEIGDMPINLQPKLLRVLQDKTYYPVGGLKKESFNARIICATNQGLDNLVEEGKFRRDLFFRFNVGRIQIPALRERKEDIEPLVSFFLDKEAQKKRKQFTAVSESALRVLVDYDWPGNVRELENCIERAVLNFDGEVLLPEHLGYLSGQAPQGGGSTGPFILGTDNFALPDEGIAIDDLYHNVIRKALQKCNGNKSRTAEYLSITRKALYGRIGKL